MNPVTDIAKSIRKSFYSAGGAEADPNFGINGKSPNSKNERGMMIYNNQQLIGAAGMDKYGEFQYAGIEYPLFRLTIQQRIEFVKTCAALFGLISSRMAKISTTPFKIVPIKKNEEREYEEMKTLYQVYTEFSGIGAKKAVSQHQQGTQEPTQDDVNKALAGAGPVSADDDETAKYARSAEKIKRELMGRLPDLVPDASNFNAAILRWKKRIQQKNFDKGQEILDWIQMPNNGVTWMDFAKKWTFDVHTHGCAAIYKKADKGRLVSFDTLPGGSVFKVKQRVFSPVQAFIQIVYGMSNQFFWQDEINYTDYMCISSQSYPFIPIESIINKLVASLLYDREMANQADGTRPPEKILAVAKKTSDPYAEYDDAKNTRMSPDAQNRLEEKVNTPKRYPIIVIDQLNGDVMEVIDIGKENILALLDMRQDKIKQDIALVYNAMPFEMGLTGSDFTSGRETSENQQNESHGKGTQPILDMLKSVIYELLPWRYGFGYTAEFDKGKDDKEERELDALKIANGEITINELRESKGMPHFEGKQFDFPKGMAPGEEGEMPQPGQGPLNPLHIKDIGE